LRRKFYNKEEVTDPIFWRERGDTTLKPLNLEDYLALKSKFYEAGRANQLIRE
jgi:hypothetical protein